MGVVSTASNIFGHIWTGQSHLHVSFANQAVLSIPFQNRLEILAAMKEGNVGNHIWKSLQSKFEKMEFLWEMEEFTNRFLVDVNRHLQGLQDSDSEGKLTNPYTGNRFHRIARLEEANLVAGIRFWADEYHYGTAIGFRFRIESLNPAEDVVKEARARVEEVLEEAVELYTVLDVKEPSTQELAAVEEMLIQF